jgi:hypothetical protein
MAAPKGSFEFVFKVAGEEQMADTLGIASDAVKDWRPAFNQIHDDFTGRIMPEQFATQGARGGAKWVGYDNEPIYRYVKSRILNTRQFPILRWSASFTQAPQPHERLYPSLVDQDHPDHVYRKSKLRFSFGTKVPYAIKHQLGTGTVPYDNVPLPKRKIISITPNDQLRWARIMQAYFMAEVGVGGRVAGRGGAGRQSPMWQPSLGF